MLNKMFSIKLKSALAKELPGYDAQIKMTPKDRQNILSDMPKNVKKSGVMLLLFLHENEYNLVFIKRAIDGGRHSGQIGFPGGGFEKEDLDLLETAKRETEEEIGVSGINILGKLTPIYIPVSNYYVLPVVGVLEFKPKFIPCKNEVSKIHFTEINEIINAKIVDKTFKINEHKINAPFYIYKNFEVWGATSMILAEFIEVLNKNKILKNLE